MHENNSRSRRERGSVLLLYTVMAGFILLLVGLGIDVTLLYVAQGQLQTGVDGAANGAVRLLGSDANETEISSEFVKANMPTGRLVEQTTSRSRMPLSPPATTNTTSTANVSANVIVPTFFMRWLGKNSTTVAASGSATVWNIQACTLTYPYGSAPSLTSVDFNEAIDLQGWGPQFILPHGKIIAWYNDEHAMTLGVYKVYVTNAAGATTTTDYTGSFTPFIGNLGAGNAATPLPVGTTALSGDQAGTDTAAWDSTYNYQNGRPMWPALFITDITTNPTANSGDWQQGGTAATPPNAIYGTWKGSVRCVNYNGSTACPPGAASGSGPGPGSGSKNGGASGSYPNIVLTGGMPIRPRAVLELLKFHL